MTHDVFISHSSRDKKAADAVCARLEQWGRRCWIAPRDIVPGTSYGASILQAINDTKVMVVILSTEANLSRHVIKEVERAVSKGVSVIPFRIEDVLPTKDLEFFLSAAHWLDAITPPIESHLQKLCDSVNALVGVKRLSPAPLDNDLASRSLKRQFEEVAPEEWRHSSHSALSRLFRRFLTERS
jgi:hypothetical protein